MIVLSGILGLMIFVLDLWAVVSVFGSEAPMSGKLLWVLLIVFLPLVGFVIWLIAGPGAERS